MKLSWPQLARRLPFRIPALAWTPDRLLAVETDGFGLRAAVLARDETRLLVEQAVVSKQPDLDAALADVLGEFERLRRPVPTDAILLAPGVLAAVAELPVDPAQPRPALQMQELVRWELEPLFAQQSATWPLEAVLVGRGHLTREQCCDLDRESDQRKQTRQRPVPIGDLAVERKLITRAQLIECQGIQEQLQAVEEDLVCGWSGQGVAGRNDSDQWRWLICGAGRRQLQHWREVFARHDLRLHSLYPLIGCSAAALNGALDDKPSAVLEIRSGLLGCLELSGGGVVSLRVRPTAGQAPDPSACSALIPQDADVVWLAGCDPHTPDLSTLIGETSGRPTRLIPPAAVASRLPPSLVPSSLVPLIGAGRHALGLQEQHRAVAIDARDPGRPLWQRVEVWMVAALCAFLALAGVLEVSLLARGKAARAAHAQATGELSQKEAALANLEERIKTIADLEKQLQARRGELEAAERKSTFLEQTLPQRGAFLQSLLGALSTATTPEVVLDRLSELDRGEIEISGWAITERAAQQFSHWLTVTLGQWNRKLVDFRMSPQEGRFGGRGYGFIARLKFEAPAMPDTQPKKTIGSP